MRVKRKFLAKKYRGNVNQTAIPRCNPPPRLHNRPCDGVLDHFRFDAILSGKTASCFKNKSGVPWRIEIRKSHSLANAVIASIDIRQ
jgi:hypothetical protein